MMWYLWCGNDSPFSGRVFHTFERAVIDDKSTWTEPKNPYFSFWEDERAVRMILTEFGLDPENGHIINGHTPVKAGKGESPVKAGGKLFIIASYIPLSVYLEIAMRTARSSSGISPTATTAYDCASASRHSRHCLRHIARVSFNSLHFSQPCVKMRSSGIRKLAISK